MFPQASKIHIKVQLLEQDKNGAFIYFLTGKLPSKERQLLSFGGYPATPLEVKNEKVKIALFGEAKQLKNLLKRINDLGVNYRVTSLTDAKFTAKTPLDELTEKQRMVMVSAFEHGYYETPRRISSEELAKKLNLRASTLLSIDEKQSSGFYPK